MLTKKLRLEVLAICDDIIETSYRVLLYFRGVRRVVKPDKSQGILDKKFMHMSLSCSIRLRYYKKRRIYKYHESFEASQPFDANKYLCSQMYVFNASEYAG